MSQSRFLKQSVAHQLSLSNLSTICKGRTHRSLWSGFPTTCPCPSVPCLPLARSRRQRAWGTLLQFKSCSSVLSLRHVSCLVACFRPLLIPPLSSPRCTSVVLIFTGTRERVWTLWSSRRPRATRTISCKCVHLRAMKVMLTSHAVPNTSRFVVHAWRGRTVTEPLTSFVVPRGDRRGRRRVLRGRWRSPRGRRLLHGPRGG